MGDFNYIGDFYNTPKVSQFLKSKGVSHKWVHCNHKLHNAMSVDFMMNQMRNMDYCLEQGLPFVQYNGMNDLACNNVGHERFLNKLRFTRDGRFQRQAFRPWVVNGTVHGDWKKHKNLVYLRIN